MRFMVARPLMSIKEAERIFFYRVFGLFTMTKPLRPSGLGLITLLEEHFIAYSKAQRLVYG